MAQRLTLSLAAFVLALAGSTALAGVDSRVVLFLGDSLLADNHGDPETEHHFGKSGLKIALARVPAPNRQWFSLAGGGHPSSKVLQQAQAYATRVKAQTHPAPTCVVIDGGANDILGDLQTENARWTARFARGKDQTADRVSDDIISNMKAAIQAITDVAPRAQFILVNIISFRATAAPGPDSDVQNVNSHVEYVNAAMNKHAANRQLLVFDFFGWSERVRFNPPKVGDLQLIGWPGSGPYDYVFADGAHPGAIANGLLANEVIDRMNAKFIDRIRKLTTTEILSLYKEP